MNIEVKMKNGDMQMSVVTINTETCLYPHAIREAFKLALTLEGFDKRMIKEVFRENLDNELKEDSRGMQP